MTKPRNSVTERTRDLSLVLLFFAVNIDMNRDVRIEETEKTVEIRDSEDNLKFTV